MVAFARWLINPSVTVWFLHWTVQLMWTGSLSLWSLAVRLELRRGLLLPHAPTIFLLAHSDEMDSVMSAWRRVSQRQRLRPINKEDLYWQLDNSEEPMLVALSHAVLQDPAFRPLLTNLEMRDRSQVRALSVLSLFEQQQQRLPPVLMAETIFTYDDLPWAAPFSVQAQLKRMSDLFLAAVLLFFTAPLVLFAAVLIWLEDRGPVFYAQQRSGWLGRPFYRLQASHDDGATSRCPGSLD